MDGQSIVAITGCVLGVVTAVSAVVNNYMTYKLKMQSQSGREEIKQAIQENTDITKEIKSGN